MGCCQCKNSTDAIQYGKCKELKLLSWNYPLNNSLKDLIDKLALYPLTYLTTLTQLEKQWQLQNNFVLANNIYNNEDMLRKAEVKDLRLKYVLQEGLKMCNLEE